MKTNKISSPKTTKNNSNKVRLKLTNNLKQNLKATPEMSPPKHSNISKNTRSARIKTLNPTKRNSAKSIRVSPRKPEIEVDVLNSYSDPVELNNDSLSVSALTSKNNSRDTSPERGLPLINNNGDVDNEIKELELEEEGEEKVNKNGELLGDREYKFKTIKVESINKDKIYLYSTNISRMFKINNTRLLFKKCPILKMIKLTTEQKNKLFKTGFLHPIVKNKSISVVEAKQAFMIFGHLIVKNGKEDIDDYYTDKRYNKQIIDKLINYSESMLSNSHIVPKENDNKQDYISFSVGLNKQILETRKRTINSFILEPHTNIMFTKRANTNFSSRITIAKNVNTLNYAEDGNDCSKLQNSKAAGLNLVLKKDFSSKHPIALMDSQYQDSFPIHHQRFGKSYSKEFLQSLNTRKQRTASTSNSDQATTGLTKQQHPKEKTSKGKTENDKNMCSVCFSLVSTNRNKTQINTQISPMECLKCSKCHSKTHYWCMGRYKIEETSPNSNAVLDSCNNCILNENIK